MAKIDKEITGDKKITVLRVTGEIAVDQIIDELTRFYAEEYTTNLIWDFSGAEGKVLSSNDMHKIIDHAKGFAHLRNNGKTAIVISSSLGYGLGRMYDTLAQVADHPIKHHVFKSYDEAVEWIGRTDTD